MCFAVNKAAIFAVDCALFVTAQIDITPPFADHGLCFGFAPLDDERTGILIQTLCGFGWVIIKPCNDLRGRRIDRHGFFRFAF